MPAWSAQFNVTSPAPPVAVKAKEFPEVSGPQNGRPSEVKSLSGTSRKPSGMHPVNWFPARVNSSRLARLAPTPTVSLRSTGYWRGSELAGWRGCPTPMVLLRSTGYRRGSNGIAPVQAGEGRGCPTPMVLLRSTGYRRDPKLSRLARLPNSDGIAPVNRLSERFKACQVGEVAQLRRYCSGQLVIGESQLFQADEVAQLRG